jgi:hypothetical protein
MILQSGWIGPVTEPTSPLSAGPAIVSDIRHGAAVEDLTQSFLDNLTRVLGRARTFQTEWRSAVAFPAVKRSKAGGDKTDCRVRRLYRRTDARTCV